MIPSTEKVSVKCSLFLLFMDLRKVSIGVGKLVGKDMLAEMIRDRIYRGFDD